MVGKVRRFRLHEIAGLRRKAVELGPSGLDCSRRVLRLKRECRPNGGARSRLCDAGSNSDGADLHPERSQVEV